MYHITIKNCNSIVHGELKIEKGKLNIFNGINGTGKTTIAKALEYSNTPAKLASLQSFISNNPIHLTIHPKIQKILVFNDDFVNNIVFVEDEVIQNSFDVFLKTEKYTERKTSLDQILQNIHLLLMNDNVHELFQLLNQLSNKFRRNKDGYPTRVGVYKSILRKSNLYNVPSLLNNFKPFIMNKDINIQWIDWKAKGDNFDISDRCPYCSEQLDRPLHDSRKNIFRDNFKKADSQNLKDLLDILGSLNPYLDPDKYADLLFDIKNDISERDFSRIFKTFMDEYEYVLEVFCKISALGNRKLTHTDIRALDQEIKSLHLSLSCFYFFGGKKFRKIIKEINKNVDDLIKVISQLKKEMGIIKGLLEKSIKNSQEDINEFLKTAGINYKLIIEAEDEGNSRAILKECFSKEKTSVSNIRNHLSWGEKNAFALVLFMYYTANQNPDLIVLDDPISSFDANKKYAILHRMFKNKGISNVSLEGQTVILLTHDFEPITDFMIIGKLGKEKVTASYIWNEKGEIHSLKISPSSDIKLINDAYSDNAQNEDINIVSRITFLRKLSELKKKDENWNLVYQILSSLIHGSRIQMRDAFGNYHDISPEQTASGITKIKQYIPDFNYEALLAETYTKEGILSLYKTEMTRYFKIQLFRELTEITGKSELKLTPSDNGWFKYIDETYHIENDHLHYLDITKFNIVPDYIIVIVDRLVEIM